MKKTLHFLLLFSSIFLVGCATIIGKKKQRVTITTNSPTVKIFLNDDSVATGKTYTTTFKRDLETKEFRFEEEGKLPRYKCLIQDRISPAYLLSLTIFSPPMMTFYVDFLNKKSYRYPSKTVFNLDFETIPVLKNTKEIRIDAIELNLEPKAYARFYMPSKHHTPPDYNFALKKSNNSGAGISYSVIENYQKIDTKCEVWRNSLKETLRKHDLIERRRLLSSNDEINIGVRFTKLNIYSLTKKANSLHDYYKIAEADITWLFKDSYGQVLLEIPSHEVSDEFTHIFDETQNIYSEEGQIAIERPINNLLTKSFFKLLNNDTKVVELLTNKPADTLALQKEGEAIESVTELFVTEPDSLSNNTKNKTVVKLSVNNAATTLDESIKACVTVKTKRGHGSGFFIGDNGEIVTNYHVVALNEAFEVVLNDGTKLNATVIATDPEHDLAILKVEHKGHKVLDIYSDEPAEIGDEVYAIGTPSSVHFNQSISKGIISGERFRDKNRIIQTDASINGGNSGGPLVTKDAQLVGVVSSKIFGTNVEGLGFVVPIEEIFTHITIEKVK